LFSFSKLEKLIFFKPLEKKTRAESETEVDPLQGQLFRR
jgi:hypothetical protein